MWCEDISVFHILYRIAFACSNNNWMNKYAIMIMNGIPLQRLYLDISIANHASNDTYTIYIEIKYRLYAQVTTMLHGIFQWLFSDVSGHQRSSFQCKQHSMLRKRKKRCHNLWNRIFSFIKFIAKWMCVTVLYNLHAAPQINYEHCHVVLDSEFQPKTIKWCPCRINEKWNTIQNERASN